MVKPNEMVVDERCLKKTLHEKIEQMQAEDLSLLNRIVTQLEVEQLAGGLDQAFDRDRREGKLSREKIQQAIAQHRSKHPYQP